MKRACLREFLYQFTLIILVLLVYILFYNFVAKNDDIVLIVWNDAVSVEAEDIYEKDLKLGATMQIGLFID